MTHTHKLPNISLSDFLPAFIYQEDSHHHTSLSCFSWSVQPCFYPLVNNNERVLNGLSRCPPDESRAVHDFWLTRFRRTRATRRRFCLRFTGTGQVE